MEDFDDIKESKDLLVINEEMKGLLLIIAKWAKFLSIMGFIAVGLMLLLSFYWLIFRTSLTYISSTRTGTGIMVVFYIIAAIIYFFPSFFLYQSSVNIKKGLKSVNQELLTSGFEFLKLQYKFKAIAIIVGGIIYLVFILITILIALNR